MVLTLPVRFLFTSEPELLPRLQSNLCPHSPASSGDGDPPLNEQLGMIGSVELDLYPGSGMSIASLGNEICDSRHVVW
jgi:hypothetical protein